MLKPIPEYDKYLYSNNRVLAFTDEGFEGISFVNTKDEPIQITDFFRFEDAIYINTVIPENTGTEEEPVIENIPYYYKQLSGKVTELETIPDKPEQPYEECGSSNWEIEKVVFEDYFVSNITNLYFKGQARFIKVSGHYESDNGLFFNVIQSGKPGLREGLYFFPKDRTSCSKIKDPGQIL